MTFAIGSSLVVFVLAHRLLFPEGGVESLLFNPLCVIHELACLVFLLWRPSGAGDEKWKSCLLFLMGGCITATLFLLKVNPPVLLLISIGTFFTSILYPNLVGFFGLFLLFMLNPDLGQWGVHLSLQLLFLLFITYLFDKEQPLIPLRNKVLLMVSLIVSFFLMGCFYYQRNYCPSALDLASLFSGGCILALAIKKVPLKRYHIILSIYIITAIAVGFFISPLGQTGIAAEFKVFWLVLIWGFLLFYFLANIAKLAPYKLQALGPILFGGLLNVLDSFHGPHQSLFLSAWIKGMSLLLLMIGLLLLIEEKDF